MHFGFDRWIGKVSLLVEMSEVVFQRQKSVGLVFGGFAVAAGEAVVLALGIEAKHGEFLALVVVLGAFHIVELLDFSFGLLWEHFRICPL